MRRGMVQCRGPSSSLLQFIYLLTARVACEVIKIKLENKMLAGRFCTRLGLRWLRDPQNHFTPFSFPRPFPTYPHCFLPVRRSSVVVPPTPPLL